MHNINGVVSATPRKHTTRPIVTGTSVLGIVYANGVMLAADTLLSYGGMAKHNGISRLFAIPHGAKTLIAASGEYSDFQMICQLLSEKALEETQTSAVLMDALLPDEDDTTKDDRMSAPTVWNYLRYVMYQKRNKFNPYWNDILVAGVDPQNKNAPFLGSVDKIGTTVKDNVLATGFGSYLAIPLLRERWRPDLTEGEARALLEDCCKVLFYRDCRASSQIQLAKIDFTTAADGTTAVVNAPIVSDPYSLETSWSDPAFVNSAPAQIDGDGGW